MSVCPHTQSYVIYGIYQAFEKAQKAIKEGNTTLAHFFLDKLTQNLQSLSGTPLVSEDNAKAIANEFLDKIREDDLNFSDTSINALIAVSDTD
jgi:hypothetical protein